MRSPGFCCACPGFDEVFPELVLTTGERICLTIFPELVFTGVWICLTIFPELVFYDGRTELFDDIPRAGFDDGRTDLFDEPCRADCGQQRWNNTDP